MIRITTLLLTSILLLMIGCSTPVKPPVPKPIVNQLSTIYSCGSSKYYSESEVEVRMKLVFALTGMNNYARDDKQLAKDIEAKSKQNKVTKQSCKSLDENLMVIAKAKVSQVVVANALATLSSTSSASNKQPYSFKPMPGLLSPNTQDFSSWAPKPANRPTTMYNASACIGTIVSGRCVGTIKPSAHNNPLQTKCYGAVVNGRCSGASF